VKFFWKNNLRLFDIFFTNLESGETFAKRGTRTKESNRAFLCPTFGRELFSKSIGHFRV